MIIDNINFSTLNTGNASHIIPIKGPKSYVMSAQNIGAEEGDPIETILNAVEIDWNGAKIDDNTTINTTVDLLNWIKSKSSNVDNEKLAEIQNTIDLYQNTFSNVLTKSYGDTIYANKTATDNSISELSAALENVITANDVQTIVNDTVGEIIGEAPEALDTLQEIAAKLGDNDDAVAALTSAISAKANAADVYTKEEVDLIVAAQTQQIETLQSENAALLERLKKLEKAFSNLVPEEPEDESYNVIVPESDEPLTIEEIIASINPEAEKPEAVQALNMNQLSNPTDTYLVYPLSWEIIEDDMIVSPVIKDWNGFEIGFNINEDTPTVMVGDVEYRVSDIKLGKGNYTIEFK